MTTRHNHRDSRGRFARIINIHDVDVWTVETNGRFGTVDHANPSCPEIVGTTTTAPVGDGWTCTTCCDVATGGHWVVMRAMCSVPIKTGEMTCRTCDETRPVTKFPTWTDVHGIVGRLDQCRSCRDA